VEEAGAKPKKAQAFKEDTPCLPEEDPAVAHGHGHVEQLQEERRARAATEKKAKAAEKKANKRPSRR
jgi:hypothetical protein